MSGFLFVGFLSTYLAYCAIEESWTETYASCPCCAEA
jgi:hypothetical protein